MHPGKFNGPKGPNIVNASNESDTLSLGNP